MASGGASSPTEGRRRERSRSRDRGARERSRSGRDKAHRKPTRKSSSRKAHRKASSRRKSKSRSRGRRSPVVRKADAKERKAREKSSSSSSSSEEETGGRLNGATGRGAKKVERALTPAEQRTKASARVLAELAADSVAAQVATVENPQRLGQIKEASVLAAALVADLGQGSFGPKADAKASVGSLADAFESAERPSAKGTVGQPSAEAAAATPQPEAGATSLAERQARAAALQGEIAKTKADIASVVSAAVTKPGGGLVRGAASSGGTSSREVGRATPPASRVAAVADPAAKAVRSGMASTGDSTGGGSSAEPTLVAPARHEAPEERAKRKAAEAAKLGAARSAAAAAMAAAAREGRPLTAAEAATIRAAETPEERAKRKAVEALAAGGRRQETPEERAKRKAAEAARAARKAQEAEKAKLAVTAAGAGVVAKNGSSSSSGAPKRELTTIYVDSGSSVSAFNLYDGLPMPDPVKDEDRKKKALITDRPKLEYTPDKTKVLFLDIDGVVRPLMGCFQMSSIVMDGENVPIVEGSSEFLPSSLAALRTILEATGCIMVMSSEWRRHDSLRDGVNRNLRMNGLPMCIDNTPQQERDMTGNPLKSFAIRRAREIGEWLRSHPEVKQWVALDDIDLGMADEERVFGQPFLTQRLVLTDKVACLTARDAKKACDILEGKLNKPRDLTISSDT